MEAVLDSGRELVILDASGDTRIIWDPDKPAEVEHAKKTFAEFKAKGYLAYKVDRKGDKGEVLRDFDAEAEKMILAPRTIGG
jgi:hypothetical protein